MYAVRAASFLQCAEAGRHASPGNTPPAPPPHPSPILKLQGRGSQESYSSPQELWQRVSGDKEAAWYAPAVAHWDAQPATYDGVLAGLGHLNSCDIAESRTFLRKAFAKQLDAAAAGSRRLVGLGTPARTGPSLRRTVSSDRGFQACLVQKPHAHRSSVSAAWQARLLTSSRLACLKLRHAPGGPGACRARIPGTQSPWRQAAGGTAAPLHGP